MLKATKLVCYVQLLTNLVEGETVMFSQLLYEIVELKRYF
jgi:hypothetical protein